MKRKVARDTRRVIAASIYYAVARMLPPSNVLGGSIFKSIRGWCARSMLEAAGPGLNVQKGVYLGLGRNISIGDHSSLGIDGEFHGPLTVGNRVIMGSQVVIHTRNHSAARLDVPIAIQGYDAPKSVTIGDGVWIGTRAIILPGVTIGHDAIVGAGAVVVKDVPPYAVVGGNPARVLKMRTNN